MTTGTQANIRARRAAKALLKNDTHIHLKVHAIENMDHDDPNRRAAVMKLLREIMRTWTLALAAQAANTSEQSVIEAMACEEPLRIGTADVARDVAAELYDPVGTKQLRARLDHLQTSLTDDETDEDTRADILDEIAELLDRLA